MALLSLARETESLVIQSHRADGWCHQNFPPESSALSPWFSLCLCQRDIWYKVSHLAHPGQASSKLLFLSVLSCQLTELVLLLLLEVRSDVLSQEGSRLVLIYGLPPLQSSLGVAVLNRVISGPRNVWHSFDITSPGIILLQFLQQRNSFRRETWRVWVLSACSDLLTISWDLGT